MASRADSVASRWTGSEDSEFASIASALAAAFGDPTRRSIFLFVRSQPGVTASEIAKRFNLHPNVVRHHLDKLVAGGYLEVDAPLRQALPGRPSRRYRVKESEKIPGPHLGSPGELLVMLATAALAHLEPAEAERLAEQVGNEYGRRLASQLAGHESHRSMKSTLSAMAEALTAHGFATVADTKGPLPRLVNENCPFGDAAFKNPIFCALDRGVVQGMLSFLKEENTYKVVFRSKAQGDSVCAASF